MAEEENNNGGDQNQNQNGGSQSDNGGNNSNNNKDGAGSGEDKDKDTDKNKDKDQSTIPSRRLKEEADKRRAVEDELATYKEKEKKENDKKLKDQGKFDELLKAKDDEITTLKSNAEKLPGYETAITQVVTSELETIKTAIGEEKLNKILGLVGFESLDAIGKSTALPKIKELVSEITTNNSKGGDGIDPNKEQDLSDVAKKGGFNGLLGAIINKATGN